MKAEEKAPFDILPKFRTLMFKLPHFLNGFIMVFPSIHKLKLQSRALLFKSIQWNLHMSDKKSYVTKFIRKDTQKRKWDRDENGLNHSF